MDIFNSNAPCSFTYYKVKDNRGGFMQFNKRYNYYSHTRQPYRINNSTFTMTVEGKGQITVKPDQAKLTIGVVTENPQVQIAQQENAMISKRVIEALKQIGIEENAIKTSIYSVQPRYDYVDGRSILKGYEVEHQLEVTVKDLSKVGTVYDVAIKNGANRSGGVQFSVTNPDAYYREALKRAVHNARENAEGLAQTIGATLTTIPIKIVELVHQQEEYTQHSLHM